MKRLARVIGTSMVAASGSVATPHCRVNCAAVPLCPVKKLRKLAFRSRCWGWANTMNTTSRAQMAAASVQATEIARLKRRASIVNERITSKAKAGRMSAKSAIRVGLHVSSGPFAAVAASRASVIALSPLAVVEEGPAFAVEDGGHGNHQRQLGQHHPSREQRHDRSRILVTNPDAEVTEGDEGQGSGEQHELGAEERHEQVPTGDQGEGSDAKQAGGSHQNLVQADAHRPRLLVPAAAEGRARGIRRKTRLAPTAALASTITVVARPTT